MQSQTHQQLGEWKIMTQIKIISLFATGLGLLLAVQQAHAAFLDSEGLRREVIGRVFSASMGIMSVQILHRPDGTSVMRGTMGSDTGQWEIRQNKICVRWQRRKRSEPRCMSIEPLGNGQYRSSLRGIILTAEQ